MQISHTIFLVVFKHNTHYSCYVDIFIYPRVQFNFPLNCVAQMKCRRTIICPVRLSVSLLRLKGDAFCRDQSSLWQLNKWTESNKTIRLTTYGSGPTHVKSQLAIDSQVCLPICEKWNLWSSKIRKPKSNSEFVIFLLYFSGSSPTNCYDLERVKSEAAACRREEEKTRIACRCTILFCSIQQFYEWMNVFFSSIGCRAPSSCVHLKRFDAHPMLNAQHSRRQQFRWWFHSHCCLWSKDETVESIWPWSSFLRNSSPISFFLLKVSKSLSP